MKHRSLLAMAISALLVASAGMTHENDEQDRALSSKAREIRIGYNIAPVPLNTRGKNGLLVGLGSYIVNGQGGCNDCHTNPNYAPGGNPYIGQPEVINAEQYLSGGRQFGPFTSKNLTPDQYGRPAGLTFEEFKNVIRTGQDPDVPNYTLQVMPWPVYKNMTDLDLRAIYEYLRAIPSLPNNPNPSP